MKLSRNSIYKISADLGRRVYKYVIVLQLLFLSGRIIAQQQPYHYKIKVVYETISQPDSNDKKSRDSEFNTLFFGESQSLYCASKYLVLDSAISSEAAKGNTFGPPMSFVQTNGTHNKLVIFKLSDHITTYDQAALFIPEMNKYNEPKSQFDWHILQDTLSFGGIHCQKAEVLFGNRKWIAWFAPSIPISEGPYKFCGLPGLILNINDEQGYWNFNMVSLMNFDTTLTIHFLNKIPQPLTSKERFFAQKKYSRDNRFELEKLSGTTFSNEAGIRQLFIERGKKDNNWIELYKGETK